MFSSIIRNVYVNAAAIAGCIGGVIAAEAFDKKLSKEGYRFSLKQRKRQLTITIANYKKELEELHALEERTEEQDFMMTLNETVVTQLTTALADIDEELVKINEGFAYRLYFDEEDTSFVEA